MQGIDNIFSTYIIQNMNPYKKFLKVADERRERVLKALRIKNGQADPSVCVMDLARAENISPQRIYKIMEAEGVLPASKKGRRKKEARI